MIAACKSDQEFISSPMQKQSHEPFIHPEFRESVGLDRRFERRYIKAIESGYSTIALQAA